MKDSMSEIEKIQTQLEQAKIDTAIELRGIRDDLINLKFSKKEKELNVEMLNKLNIAFKTNDDVNSVSLNDFKSFIAQNKITDETIVFNNLLDTKKDFKTKWEVPAKNSWHQRLF